MVESCAVDYIPVNILSNAKILACIEVGDSLTVIRNKTNLSYVTVQYIISHLELNGIITINEIITKHGKPKICTDIKPGVKEAAKELLAACNRFNTLLCKEIN